MAGGGCLLLSLLPLDSGGSAPARGFGKLTSLQFCPPLRLSSSVVHPLSIRTPQASPGSRLRLGLPAAPEAYYLPLLPSGPDGVRSASPRRAGSSTPLARTVPTAPGPRAGIQPRYSGLRVQGTASSPSSTTSGYPTTAPRGTVKPNLATEIRGCGRTIILFPDCRWRALPHCARQRPTMLPACWPNTPDVDYAAGAHYRRRAAHLKGAPPSP